jgi:hypothetical protein
MEIIPLDAQTPMVCTGPSLRTYWLKNGEACCGKKWPCAVSRRLFVNIRVCDRLSKKPFDAKAGDIRLAAAGGGKLG